MIPARFIFAWRNNGLSKGIVQRARAFFKHAPEKVRTRVPSAVQCELWKLEVLSINIHKNRDTAIGNAVSLFLCKLYVVFREWLL